MQTEKETSKTEKQQVQLNDSTHKELKVLLINGSPRKEGNTYLALMEVSKQLEKNGIATELLQIGTQPMQWLHCVQSLQKDRSLRVRRRPLQPRHRPDGRV